MPAQALFAFAVNIDKWPAWRSDVDTVTHQEGEGFQAEIMSGEDTLTYQFDADFGNLSMVSIIMTKDIPFGGSWEILVETAGGQSSRITVTEKGYVDPVLWRFVSRFVIGHETSARQYLEDLEAACANGDCKAVTVTSGT